MTKAITASPKTLQSSVHTTGWSKAVATRHRTILNRLVAAGISAIVFAPIIGPVLTLSWLGVYMLVLGMERIVVRPERGRDGKAPEGLFGIACDGILLTTASVFAWITIPLWLQAGIIGGICACVYLGAGLLQSIINGAGSIRVTLLTILPSTLAALATPWLMAANDVPQEFLIAVTTAVIVFLGICHTAASRLHQADREQASAFALAERKRLEAEKAVEERTAFLSMIAHDLRTPITAILSGTQQLSTLPEHSLDAGQAQTRLQALGMIEDASRMMNGLLNDLLDQARIDAGCMNINTHPFELRQVIEQTVALWTTPVRSKGLQLDVELPHHLPRALVGDEMRLRQVLNNLFSNAYKFTDTGSIALRCAAWEDDQGDLSLTLELADTGNGMSPEQLDRLFGRFEQANSDIAANYGGSGLGLSISYDLVRMMDGRLTARSKRGEGSTFTLALTLAISTAEELAAHNAAHKQDASPPLFAVPVLAMPPASPAQASAVSPSTPMPTPLFSDDSIQTTTETASAVPPPEEEPASVDDAAPLRVLVVDDHEINRRAIQLILQPFDCDITLAGDGITALELAATSIFDVIFMDVRMPELDGRETTRRLRSNPGPNVDTPVIAVTADSSTEDQSACIAAGMDDFVAKPLTPASLINALQSTLEKDAARREAA